MHYFLKSLIFDFERDPYKGVVAFIRVFQGEIEKGEDIELVAVKEDGEVKELGFFNPKLQPKKNYPAERSVILLPE